jgi:hypothetical protein
VVCAIRRSSRPLKVASQLPDRAAELGLDAVGLLQAGLEQLLDERPVSGRPAVAKYACNPCANSSSSGSVATSTSFLMPGDGRLVEGRDPARESVGEALDLIVGDQPVHVTVLSGQAAGMSSPPSGISRARPWTPAQRRTPRWRTGSRGGRGA